MPERVVLVGFMGAGKSSVGRALAERLGWGLVDMDDEIARRTGRSVRQLFAERGEAAFRDEELREARRISGLARVVVAAGGGAFAHPPTREVLADGAVTVWLRCSLDTLLARVGEDPDRPLASDRETMRALLRRRDGAYRSADHTLDGEGATPQQLAERIARLLEAAPQRAGEPDSRCDT